MLVGKIYQRYIIFSYLKNFFIIFLALEFFYVGVDLIVNLKDLPSSANLQLLYAYYNSLLAINYTLPLSIVFALISSKISMIKSNELVSLYASGIGKNQIIRPLFVVAFFLTLILLALNCTSFAYSYEHKSNILKHNRISNDSTKLFVKYNNKYIYISSLNPVKKVAFGVKIFDVDGVDLKNIISSKKAIFKDNAWLFEDADMIIFPQKRLLGSRGFEKKKLQNITLLKGFKPSIVDTLHENKSYLSIIDAYEAIDFLTKQGSDTTWVKSSFYALVFFPFFAPLMLMILFFYMPLTSRFFNTALLSFAFIFTTLCVWGVIFVLTKFSSNGVISPELAVVFPIFLMALFAVKLFYSNK